VRRSSRAGDPIELSFTVALGGTGSQTINVLQLCGSVRVLEHVAEIVEATTLTNATAVYADLYDGTNTIGLTLSGATLSGCPVGTVFVKDQVSTLAYAVCSADQCRLNESIDLKKMGRPFSITAKGGVDNYIRLHYTTTDNPIDAVLMVKVVYEPLDGGCLVIV
jgi:hypothetical protein